MTNFTKGSIAITLGVLCASSIEVIGSFVMSKGIDPVTLLNVRYWIATVLMLATVLVLRKSLFIERKDIKHLLLQSSLLCAHTLVYWWGLEAMKNIPSALVIHRLYPIWIILISFYFLKEKIGTLRIWSLIAGMVGALFVTGFLPYFHFIVNAKGAIFMALASIFYALLLVSGREIMKKYNQFSVLFYNFLFTGAVLMLIQPPTEVISHITPVVLPYIIIMGVVSTYLLYLFNYTGLKYVKASDFVLIYQSKPIISIALAFLVLGQFLEGFQWLGAALVFGAMYLLAKDHKYETK